MTNGVNLLPCPFCGDRDIRLVHGDRAHPNDRAMGWRIECGSCPCELRWFCSEEEARRYWNTRLTDEPPGDWNGQALKRANQDISRLERELWDANKELQWRRAAEQQPTEPTCKCVEVDAGGVGFDVMDCPKHNPESPQYVGRDSL